MEQTEYWMWTKQQHNPYYIDLSSSYIFPSSSRTSRRHHLLPCTRGGDYSSWEEQAFAEDAASSGGLGGCIWPPRSYSCTFCNKDFMSAQALGGHMNVHRRDRARLKQSQAHNNQGNILEAQTSCNFSLNPFLEFVNQDVATTTTSSAIRVSSSSRLDYSNNNETQYLFPYVQEQSTIFHQKSGLNHSERQAHLSTSSRAKGENFAKPDLSISQNPREGQGPTMTARPNKRNFVKADLSISLNLVICSSNNNNNHSCASDDDEDEDGRCKIRRIDPASALNLFNIEQDDEQRTMNHTVSCIDDIDLELRLGGSAKVK